MRKNQVNVPVDGAVTLRRHNLLKCPRCGSTRHEEEYAQVELAHAICSECLPDIVPMVKRVTDTLRNNYSRGRSKPGVTFAEKVKA